MAIDPGDPENRAREHFGRVDRLLEAALKLKAQERRPFLSQACQGEPGLLREVESLLSSHDEAGDFLESPALGRVARDFTAKPTSSLTGQRIGPYELISFLGAGGMGEVYQARDTRLDRSVAIKFLPDQTSGHGEMRRRLEREARIISALNHPHICTLHDVGEHEGSAYLVMEYLEGETLTNRLRGGRLPLDQALRYGIQLADALSAAHRNGVTHRDVKPRNIVLVSSGVKLLDFGLAKISRPDPGNDPKTAEGTIVGTIQYMAPEQLEGRDADARTDLFAFGAVLYEMATGCKAFEGKSQAGLIAAIMSRVPPPVSTLQPLSPRGLDRLIERCLTKAPEERWQSAQDLKSELEWIQEDLSNAGHAPPGAALRPGVGRREWILLAAGSALGMGLGLGIGSIVIRNPSPAETGALVITIGAPEGTALASSKYGASAISPNGLSVVFTAIRQDGQAQLFLERLDSSESPGPLRGTEDAYHPFWRPDSNAIGFFSQGDLKTLELPAGRVTVLVPNMGSPGDNQGKGGTWSRKGVIVYAKARLEPLYAIRDTPGGSPAPVTTLETGQQDHVWPHFLPDGEHFVYLARSNNVPLGEPGRVYVGSLEGDRPVPLFDHGTSVIPSSGHLLFARSDVLMARSFDEGNFQVGDDERPVGTDPVGVLPGIGRALFSVARNNRLAFDAVPRPTQLTRLDRGGVPAGPSIGGPQMYRDLRLAPDGLEVAYSLKPTLKGSEKLWFLTLATGGLRSKGDVPSLFFPVWHPKEDALFFAGPLDDRVVTFRTSRYKTEPPTPFLEDDEANIRPMDVSADGRHLLLQRIPFVRSEFRGSLGLHYALLTGGERPQVHPILDVADQVEKQARFSPDGNWVAYVSDESGQDEVFIRELWSSGRTESVSAGGGGTFPLWCERDGVLEVVYLSADRFLMSVALTRTPTSFAAGRPTRLFRAPGHLNTGAEPQARFWDMPPDGESVYIAVDDALPPINVVVNWTARLDG